MSCKSLNAEPGTLTARWIGQSGWDWTGPGFGGSRPQLSASKKPNQVLPATLLIMIGLGHTSPGSSQLHVHPRPTGWWQLSQSLNGNHGMCTSGSPHTLYAAMMQYLSCVIA